MVKRSISDRQRAWLVRQLDDWQSHGLLTADQAAPILDHYLSPSMLAERKRSLVFLALLGFAALLVGLGTLLLVGYNWEAIPDVLKLIIIFGVILGTQAVGFLLRFRRQAKLLSEAAFFLGCLFYGAGIFLVAQIFHLNAHYPAGVWWWSLGVLTFAFCLDSLLVHVLLVSLLAVWCWMEIIGFGDAGFWWIGPWWLIPKGAYSLPLLSLPGLLWAYRKGSVATVTLYASLLVWWAILQPIAWEWVDYRGLKIVAVHFLCAVAGLLLVIAESHPTGSRFAIPFRLFGVLVAAGVLLAMSFYKFSEVILNSGLKAIDLVQALVIVILSTATIYVAAVFHRRGLTASLSVPQQIQQILRRLTLPIALVIVMVILLAWHLTINEPLLPTIVANVAIFFLIFWLVSVGLREGRSQPFAAGVLYFVLWAIARYVDLFGGIFGGMAGAARLFFFCGVVLFVVALFWRNRRRKQMVKSTTEQNDALLAAVKWIDCRLEWVKSRERALLIVGVGFQLVVLVTMTVTPLMTLVTGDIVLLRVEPVDPRDLFRGDYVILRYEFSSVPPQGISGLKPENLQGQTAFVALAPEEDGLHWRASRLSLQRPPTGKFLRGQIKDRIGIEFGIESYFVQEGEGSRYENALRNGNLSAEIAVDRTGKAILKRLVIDE